MKSKCLLIIMVFTLMWGKTIVAQTENERDSTKMSGGAVIGAVTADGKNYQQFSLRADIPIGKLGFGVDIQLLIDEKGQIRSEDWDEWQDYLDKLYYVRWGWRGDPLYIKVGGLDYSFMGYNNIVNGYSNMVQYPTIKRYGGEVSFYIPGEDDKKLVGAEVLVNNFKELSATDPGMMIATRVFASPIWKLQIGATLAMDLNEFNALPDADKDKVPDYIDLFPKDNHFATQMDKVPETRWNQLRSAFHNSDGSMMYDSLVAWGFAPKDTSRMADLMINNKSQFGVFGFDFGVPLVSNDVVKLDVYSHFSKMGLKKIKLNDGTEFDGGWGMALPGVRLTLGENNLFTLTAEYRKSSEHFLFGYFNYTYELERANFVKDDATGKMSVVSKQQTLYSIDKGLNGFFVGMNFNIMNFVNVTANYQDLVGDSSQHVRSMKGEVNIGQSLKQLLPISEFKAYYVQNNVQDFKEWKTPSTVMGILIGYNFSGANIGLEYRYNFHDINGDGLIRGTDETIKTIGFRTTVNF